MHNLDRLILENKVDPNLTGEVDVDGYKGRCTIIGLSDEYFFILRRHDDKGDYYLNSDDTFFNKSCSKIKTWYSRKVKLDSGRIIYAQIR